MTAIPRLRAYGAPLGMTAGPLGLTDADASVMRPRPSRTELRRDLTDLIGVPGLV
jgi:hypothetical protein